MSIKIPVTRSSMPGLEEYISEIRELWDSCWLTNMGVKHRQLEAELKKYLGASNLSLFTNGHLALEYTLEALDLKGEVITTPFTFISTTHAIVRCGLTPIFCDINDEDFTLNPELIEELISENTTAILPVHVYGHICDYASIQRIADKHGLAVIYDAAHAFGVTVKNESLQGFGNASMFSFHATKVFNTIEGGAVTYSDVELGQKLDLMKNFGITGPETVELVGGNAKMNEFQAAMGLCNLRHIDEDISRRKPLFAHYRDRLREMESIYIPPEKSNIESNYAYLPVLFDGNGSTRDTAFTALAQEGIHSRKYFYPLTSAVSCYEGRFEPLKTPIAKRVADCILTLPLYADMSIDDVDRVCDVLLRL